MRLLFLSDVPLENPTSGAEQVLNNQTAGLILRGFDVFAITRKNGLTKSVEYKNVNGVKEACYNATPRNAFRFFLSLLRKPNILFETFHHLFLESFVARSSPESPKLVKCLRKTMPIRMISSALEKMHLSFSTTVIQEMTWMLFSQVPLP